MTTTASCVVFSERNIFISMGIERSVLLENLMQTVRLAAVFPGIFCTSSFSQILVPKMEHLYLIDIRGFQPHWLDDIGNYYFSLGEISPFLVVRPTRDLSLTFMSARD